MGCPSMDACAESVVHGGGLIFPSQKCCVWMLSLKKKCNGAVATSCGNDFLGKNQVVWLDVAAYCKKTSMESETSMPPKNAASSKTLLDFEQKYST